MTPHSALAMLTHLLTKHHLTPLWRPLLDNAKTRAGLTNHTRHTISLSRNFITACSESDLRDVCLHEIAHALVGPNHGHGATWKAKALAIGCTGQRRCAAFTITYRYEISCSLGCRVYRRHRLHGGLLNARCRSCGRSMWITAQRTTQ